MAEKSSPAAARKITAYGSEYITRTLLGMWLATKDYDRSAREFSDLSAMQFRMSYEPVYDMVVFTVTRKATNGDDVSVRHMVQADLLCATAPVSPVVAVKSRL